MKRADIFRIGEYAFPASDVCSNGRFRGDIWTGPPRAAVRPVFDRWTRHLLAGLAPSRGWHTSLHRASRLASCRALTHRRTLRPKHTRSHVPMPDTRDLQAASKRWKQARFRPWVVSRTHFSTLNTGRYLRLLFGMGLPLEGKLEAKARGFDTAVSTVRTRDFGRMMNRDGQDSFGLRIAEPNVAHTWAEARLLLFVLLFGFVLLFQTCGRSSAIPYLRRLTLLVPRSASASASIHRVLPGLPSTLGPNSLH